MLTCPNIRKEVQHRVLFKGDLSSENTVVTLTKRKGTTQERTPLQRGSNSDQIQTNSLDRARRWPTSTLISLALPRSPDLLRLSVRDRSGEGRGQGGSRLPVQFSGSDQKSAARCVTACGDPRQRSSKTCSKNPSSYRTVTVWTCRGGH